VNHRQTPKLGNFARNVVAIFFALRNMNKSISIFAQTSTEES